MGVGCQRHAPAALPPRKIRYPLYRRLDGPPGPVWTGAENLAPYRDPIPGPSSREVRSTSQYTIMEVCFSPQSVGIYNFKLLQ